MLNILLCKLVHFNKEVVQCTLYSTIQVHTVVQQLYKDVSTLNSFQESLYNTLYSFGRTFEQHMHSFSVLQGSHEQYYTDNSIVQFYSTVYGSLYITLYS